MNRVEAALLAGLAGTVPFLGLVRTFPKLNKLEVELIRTATELFSPTPRGAKILAVAIPLSLGSVFAFPYAAAWESGWGTPNIVTGTTFGVAHGLAIILAKPVFRLAHPRPFRLPQGEVWVTGEVISHVLYGVTVALCYREFTKSKA